MIRDEKSPVDVRDPVSTGYSSSVKEVAKTLAAHGGGAASFELALDLVLNEMVEQARLVTGATGAAIALARAGEMVCRATTGGDAPDLGVRLETTSGLSGACLQTGTIQQCVDAETDPRVNAGASQRLGVRSILVLPLGEEKEPFGILEVFSSRPNAFGDRDINTLQVLARRVADNKKGADEISVARLSAGSKSHSSIETMDVPVDESVSRSEASDRIEGPSPKQNEILPAVLSVLVIVTAVLLGLALGWRAGSGRGTRRAGQPPAEVLPSATSSFVPDAAKEKTAAPLGAPATSPIGNLLSAAEIRSAATPTDPPVGGLQVTQNGKVIYRLPPVEQVASGKGTVPEPSENLSATRLMHRVEPEYPPEARAQHLQGAVKLDVQIGGAGTVQNIQVAEGDALLARAAVRAVRQWLYRPYIVDGHPVEMQTRITIRFTLPSN